MRRASERDRAAASFYGLGAGSALLAAVATADLILVGVGVVLFVAAIAALRRYPFDHVW